MHLCKSWLRENAYSSFKSVERPSIYTLSYLIIISLFKNHFCHSKYIFGDVLDNCIQKFEEKSFFAKKNKKNFCPRMRIFIFTFQFCYLASSLWIHLQFETHFVDIFLDLFREK